MDNYGWEIVSKVEKEKPTARLRALITVDQIKTTLLTMAIMFGLLSIFIWLANNPFEYTQRIQSDYVISHGWGTSWSIVWWVVIVCALLEYLDSAAGMGYGTALAPLLLVAGFDLKQIVPLIMITELCTGFICGKQSAVFENIEWKWTPPNEVVKLVIMVAGIGMVTSVLSVTSVYKFFQSNKVYVEAYTAFLLMLMGLIYIYIAHRKKFKYNPKLMWLWGGIAGLNKGLAGGGYGPIVTVGGMWAGVPAKSMVAVTSYAEAFTCVAAVIAWGYTISSGTIVDFGLLPSMFCGTILGSIIAPYTTRVLPEKIWRFVVPIYCFILGAFIVYKIFPKVIQLFN